MQNTQMQKVLFWFGMIMAAVFICCGFFFLLNKTFLERVPETNRTILGIVFILYGSFRATRQYSRYKQLQQRRDEE